MAGGVRRAPVGVSAVLVSARSRTAAAAMATAGATEVAAAAAAAVCARRWLRNRSIAGTRNLIFQDVQTRSTSDQSRAKHNQ